MNYWLKFQSYSRLVVNTIIFEKHGKSPCDSEFSVISQWLEEITSSSSSINTTQELISSLTLKSTTNSTLNPNNFIERVFVEYTREARPTVFAHLQIPDFKAYHSFRSVKSNTNTIEAKTDSKSKTHTVNVKHTHKKETRKTKRPPQSHEHEVSHLGVQVLASIKKMKTLNC